MKRRAFLTALGAAAALPALADGAKRPAPKGTEGAAFLQPPTAQLVGGDALAICWRTAGPSAGTVRWTQDPALPPERWATAHAARDGLTTSNRPDHLVVLRGLDPAKPVRFQAQAVATKMNPWWTYFGERAEGPVTEIPPLLAADGSLTFAILNDLHANAALIPSLMALPAVQAAKPAFVALLGDCAGNVAGPEALRDALLGPMADLTARGLPLLFLRGNHEYRGVMARRLREAFHPFLGTDAYYGAFDLGPLRLLCLDCGEDKPDDHREYCGLLDCEPYIEEEAAWLRREVASPQWKAAQRRLALLHIPPERGEPKDDAWHGPTRIRRLIAPTLREAGLDALICAHTHRADFRPPSEAYPYPTHIGGGPKAEIATVTLVKATPDALTVTMLRADGTPVA